MKEKTKISMKLVRIDSRTLIEVPESIPDEIAIASFKERLDQCRKTSSGYNMHKNQDQVGKKAK